MRHRLKNKRDKNVPPTCLPAGRSIRRGFLTPLKEFSGEKSIIIKSPAKVNLALNVVSKREDDYHNLETIMIPVSLCDYLEIQSIEGDKIKILCNNKKLPLNGRNIINKAVRLLWNEMGKKRGVIISLKKNIPISAGLGGGSSNGASTLLALNKLWGINLSLNRLIELGAKLGADVPFFIYGKPALAKGIGEDIYPVKIKRRFWLIIMNPGFPVSTAWVYKNLNLALTKKNKNIKKLTSLLKEGRNPDAWSKYLSNDLESVTLQKFPVLSEIKKLFIEAGALNALMAGSGSSVFGVFSSKRAAESAYSALKGKALGDIFLVKNL